LPGAGKAKFRKQGVALLQDLRGKKKGKMGGSRIGKLKMNTRGVLKLRIRPSSFCSTTSKGENSDQRGENK